LAPNSFLNTLFSIIFSFCFSLNMRNQVSHPCKITSKVILVVLHISIFVFLDRQQKDRMIAGIFLGQSAVNFFFFMQFWSPRLLPKIWTLPQFQRSRFLLLCCYFVLRSDLETWTCTWFCQHLYLGQSSYWRVMKLVFSLQCLCFIQ
jgi:hypothetical protein